MSWSKMNEESSVAWEAGDPFRSTIYKYSWVGASAERERFRLSHFEFPPQEFFWNLIRISTSHLEEALLGLVVDERDDACVRDSSGKGRIGSRSRRSLGRKRNSEERRRSSSISRKQNVVHTMRVLSLLLGLCLYFTEAKPRAAHASA
jgi:hypothetical protein